MTVSFLTNRVKKPDEDDWGELKRVLCYLKGIEHMKLTLSVDNMSVLSSGGSILQTEPMMTASHDGGYDVPW